MKERPILFSKPMVQAILDGRKTQTRRAVKIPKAEPLQIQQWGYTCFTPPGHISFRGIHANGEPGESFVKGRYGLKGDRLWVRERMRVVAVDVAPRAIQVRYEADDAKSQWMRYPERLKGKPEVDKCLSYGGFREASRITLEITNVRVERLNAISEADAKAEGLVPTEGQIMASKLFAECRPDLELVRPHQQAFSELWETINGKKYPWASNPWVWVVEFKRV